MPLNIAAGGVIAGLAGTNQAILDAAHSAIGKLTYADITSQIARQLRLVPPVRIDMQGQFNRGGDVWNNIQAQVAGGTIACALVRLHSIDTANTQNQAGAVNAVVSALNQSLDSGNIYEITGELP